MSGQEKKGLIEAAGGWARTPKECLTNEESDLSWITLKRTENRLLSELAELSRNNTKCKSTVQR